MDYAVGELSLTRILRQWGPELTSSAVPYTYYHLTLANSNFMLHKSLAVFNNSRKVLEYVAGQDKLS